MGVRHIASQGMTEAAAAPSSYLPQVKQGRLDWGNDPSEFDYMPDATQNQRSLPREEHTTAKADDITVTLTITVPMSVLPEMDENNYDRVLAKAEEKAMDKLVDMFGFDINDKFEVKFDMVEYEEEIEIKAFLYALAK